MNLKPLILGSFGALAGCLLMPDGVPPARAFIDVPPATLGHLCSYGFKRQGEDGPNIAVLKVEKVHKEKKIIVYRITKILKGKWPGEFVHHHVTSNGAMDIEPLLELAKPGQTAVTFYVPTAHWASYTYIDGFWYISRLFVIDSKVIDDWGKWDAYWGRHSQLRTFSGKGEELATAVTAILKGEEVVVPCMVADKLEDLAKGRGKARRMRASLKLQDYDPKRDLVE